MKKEAWKFILPMILPVLVVGILLSALLNKYQADYPVPFPLTFVGEYSYDGGPWTPYEAGTEWNACKGDLVLRGHFSEELGENTVLSFYRNHIGIGIYRNEEPVYMNFSLEVDQLYEDARKTAVMKKYGCAAAWEKVRLEGVGEEAPVELRLMNPHRHGNESAYEEFLKTLCIIPAAEMIILDQALTPYGQPQQVMGVITLVIALVLLGAALATRLMKETHAAVLTGVGALAVCGASVLIFDSINISLVCQREMFNTYALHIGRMMFGYCLGLLAARFLQGKRRRILDVAMVCMGLVNGAIILLAGFSVVLLYDAMAFWQLCQVVLIPLMLVLCLRELLQGAKKEDKPFLISVALLCTALIVDAFGPLDTVLSHWTCTKLTFILLVVGLLIKGMHDSILLRRAADRAKKLEAELEENRISTMMSQIQPHFLYNSLTATMALCDRDPQLAKESIADFADYLRANLDALSNVRLVSVRKELEHVRTYLRLEQLRFEEALQVEYDLQTQGFMLPPLTIQPLVENAVKHGVGKKEGGGTVRISTWETEEAYVVEVRDDGVGFAQEDESGRQHVGIANVRSRLKMMCSAELEIRSEQGVGTTAVIRFPREGGPK